jgi:hypothetical protein
LLSCGKELNILFVATTATSTTTTTAIRTTTAAAAADTLDVDVQSSTQQK